MQSYETLADRKLHLLFELWDKDGDGLISFAELALGLRKLSPPEEPVTQTAADAAEVGLPITKSLAQRCPVGGKHMKLRSLPPNPPQSLPAKR